MGGGVARLSTVQLGAGLPVGWWRGTPKHCTARLKNVNKNYYIAEAKIIICNILISCALIYLLV